MGRTTWRSTPRQMASCPRPGGARTKGDAREAVAQAEPCTCIRVWVEKKVGGSKNQGWFDRPVARVRSLPEVRMLAWHSSDAEGVKQHPKWQSYIGSPTYDYM